MEIKRWISSKDLFGAIEVLLEDNKQASFTVTGMSMWPFLCHGQDQVIVEKCAFEEMKKGDIILFRTKTGKYLLHRVSKIQGNQFETMGDGNCFKDGWFDRTCLKARVLKFTRKGKWRDCQALNWKLLFHIWMFCFPIRPFLLSSLKTISHIKNMR